ncbi:MAG: hypothetical protein HOV76_19495, partial [Hamadaea sp.]|nr:hypothetical protein [Hamadaea sp.]
MARDAERPDDGRGRRKGRGGEPQEVPQEETGWLDDLRHAKEAKVDIGPGGAAAGPGEKTRGGSGDSRWAALRGESGPAAAGGPP